MDDKNVAFRAGLVNRCQKEFEKNSGEEKFRMEKIAEIEEATDPVRI